jgi:peptide/nickel transport system ATP-binding protein
MTKHLLEVIDLKKYFKTRNVPFGPASLIRGVEDVSFHIDSGETLALVGESGCGKTTVGRAILRFFDITAGQIIFDGQRIENLSERALRPLRRRFQIIFQDPFSSLNPRLRVHDILAEPIRNFGLARTGREVDVRISTLLDQVRLPHGAANGFPHEFSGGQRQRIAIARALATEPEIIVCDEAVSALDVSVKAQIINLLQDLQCELGLSLLFISHDLAVVEHIAHRAAIMYLGRIVEMGPTQAIFGAPKHPYTRALLSAVPIADPGAVRRRILLNDELPSAGRPPIGCPFHTRCPDVFARCRTDAPQLQSVDDDRIAACHLNDGCKSEQS